MGMTSPIPCIYEALNNFQVILLLISLVAGIYFMKDLLLFCLRKSCWASNQNHAGPALHHHGCLFVRIFGCLTVTAVIIAVALGFYNIYHRVALGESPIMPPMTPPMTRTSNICAKN
ncbi:MAG: hypothetical protein R3B83_03730 [Nitrospirales bacterium]